MSLNYRFLISAFYSNMELLGDNSGSSLSLVLDSRQEYNAMNISLNGLERIKDHILTFVYISTCFRFL